MTSFNKFLSQLKAEDPALIECVSNGFTLMFENATNDNIQWDVVDCDLSHNGGTITVNGDATFTAEIISKHQDVIGSLLELYNQQTSYPVEMPEFIENLQFGAVMTYSGSMYADGDMHGDWYVFEVDTSEGYASFMYDGDEFSTAESTHEVFGTLADDVISTVDESSAVKDRLDAIGENTYKSNPGNRWAYGATY